MNVRTVNYVPAHIKDLNRQSIYEMLSAGGPTSRAQLSRDSGISLPTVNKIVKHFVDLGLVVEVDEPIALAQTRLGRRPQLIAFEPTAFVAVGVEYEGNSIAIGLVDLVGEVRAMARLTTDLGLSAPLAEVLADNILGLMAGKSVERSRVLGVGVGLPGVVDVHRRTVAAGPLVGVSAQTSLDPLAAALNDRLNLPITFENDVNAAAIGEHRARGADAPADLFYISLGTGLGGGLILDGTLRRGAGNFAGEIGYLVFDDAPDAAGLKAGWLEDRIGLGRAGNESADYVSRQLALSIVNIAVATGVEHFVLGGASIDRFGRALVDEVRGRVAGYSDFPLTVEATVCPAPGVVGAATLVIADTLPDRWQD